MRLFLMIDIGAGTMDILCYDADSGEHIKAVIPSPVRHKAWLIDQTNGPLVVEGSEMGGGPVTESLRRRLENHAVVLSQPAAASLHHDMDRVRSWGFDVRPASEIEPLLSDPAYTRVQLSDVDLERLSAIFKGFGWPMRFEVVALCAQDHGVAPKNISHLDFRNRLFRSYLKKKPKPEHLLFEGASAPPAFNRLRCMAESARALDTNDIYVMDSGMAAILGASLDPFAATGKPVAVLDVATSHTVGAIVIKDEIAGFFEYHTHDVTVERIDGLLRDLADGRIDHRRILSEGGHGAFVNKTVGFDTISAIIATGPKRRLMARSRLPIIWGAPWGDNMMTGAVGLLEAVRRHKKMAPIAYL